MFVGRIDLISLVDRSVLVGDGPETLPEVPRGADRPVLILEGLGGSGRAEFLRFTWQRWARKTPTAWIAPKVWDSADDISLRPLLVSMLQGLSNPVDGYGRVRFPRVVLAHIAMDSPIPDVDPERARARLRERMNRYRDHRNLIDFVGELITQFGGVLEEVQAPGAARAGQAIAEQAARRIVDSLREARWLTKLGWDDALTWFGHQDSGLPHPPEKVLINLSRQASSREPEVQKEIDELLIGALLADLRESLGRVAGRPWNALILLNDGDLPIARSFVAALIRVRETRALRAPAAAAPVSDPLVVLTTSGGALAPALAAGGWEDPNPDPPRPTGSRWWVPIQLGELTEQDIRAMAKEYLWPPELGTGKVVHAVHRVTRGHAAATDLLLRGLRDAPQQVNDLDGVLKPKERELLDRIVAGITPNGQVDGPLRDQLVTCAAARNQLEAELLLTWLRETVRPSLMASTTLWAGRDASGNPVLPPFVRYLGLSALARRGADHKRGWSAVFTRLLDGAVDREDVAGQLHHRLALGDTAPVVEELTRLLDNREEEHWLALLDQITITPDLRTRPSMPGEGARRGAEVSHLVATLRAARDPRLADVRELQTGYGMLADDLRAIIGSSPAFQQRAQSYDRLAGGSR